MIYRVAIEAIARCVQMPRVPMQGLSNVVPPQDPNHVPFPNIGNTLANIDFGKKLLQILGERKVMSWI